MKGIQKHDAGTKELFLKRTFEICAGFLSDYLKPGVSIIDCGCGPGNLTIELAKRVAPGKVVGMDVDESSLAIAREMARKQSVDNVEFTQGDIYKLPYENDLFDIAYSHAVLSNLKEPVKALAEYARIVKPNGIVAVRESDYSNVLVYPEKKGLLKTFEVLGKLGSLYGDLCIGKKLRKLFSDAGLTNTIATASCESYGDLESLRSMMQYLVNQIKEPDVHNLIIQSKWATEQELTECIESTTKFAEDSGSFFAYNWVACIGFKN